MNNQPAVGRWRIFHIGGAPGVPHDWIVQFSHDRWPEGRVIYPRMPRHLRIFDSVMRMIRRYRPTPGWPPEGYVPLTAEEKEQAYAEAHQYFAARDAAAAVLTSAAQMDLDALPEPLRSAAHEAGK